ncbi:hypothetical protein INR49_020376 [Caranx melampygus]|nr:hypothetical protein INR49_020376 [Caranx melampygus]
MKKPERSEDEAQRACESVSTKHKETFILKTLTLHWMWSREDAPNMESLERSDPTTGLSEQNSFHQDGRSNT